MIKKLKPQSDYPEHMNDRACISDLVVISSKINELIDYLNAKEEASKGECNHDWHPSGEYCVKCRITYKELMKDKAYLVDEKNFKFNPPEHEDWEDDFTDKFCGTGRFADFESFKEVKDYIRDNFVSKEKIKREANRIVEQYPTNEDFRYGIKRGIKELVESLGLGY